MKTNSEKALHRITPDQAKMLYQVLLGHYAGTLDRNHRYDPGELSLALDYLRLVVLYRSEEKYE